MNIRAFHKTESISYFVIIYCFWILINLSHALFVVHREKIFAIARKEAQSGREEGEFTFYFEFISLNRLASVQLHRSDKIDIQIETMFDS